MPSRHTKAGGHCHIISMVFLLLVLYQVAESKPVVMQSGQAGTCSQKRLDQAVQREELATEGAGSIFAVGG